MKYKIITNTKEKEKFIRLLVKEEDINILNFADLVVINFNLSDLVEKDFTFKNFHLLDNENHCWIFNKKHKSFIFDMKNNSFQDWNEIKELFNLCNEIIIKEKIL